MSASVNALWSGVQLPYRGPDRLTPLVQAYEPSSPESEVDSSESSLSLPSSTPPLSPSPDCTESQSHSDGLLLLPPPPPQWRWHCRNCQNYQLYTAGTRCLRCSARYSLSRSTTFLDPYDARDWASYYRAKFRSGEPHEKRDLKWRFFLFEVLGIEVGEYTGCEEHERAMENAWKYGEYDDMRLYEDDESCDDTAMDDDDGEYMEDDGDGAFAESHQFAPPPQYQESKNGSLREMDICETEVEVEEDDLEDPNMDFLCPILTRFLRVEGHEFPLAHTTMADMSEKDIVSITVDEADEDGALLHMPNTIKRRRSTGSLPTSGCLWQN